MIFCVESKADQIRTAGDYLQVGLPLIGLTASYVQEDYELVKESLRGMVINTAITQSLKYSINRTRPDGGDLSFPSGHTSAAFHGAAFIALNFDSRYAIPAYALATLVGYSRVRANRHYVSDVIAGAAIGILSARLAKNKSIVNLQSYKDEEETLWVRFYTIW
jgi:hypothetical protein